MLGASIGTALGVTIDVATLGTTLGIPTVILSASGAAVGKWIDKLITDKNGRVKIGKITIKLGADNMPKDLDMQLFYRVLSFSIEIGSRSHANHKEINIKDRVKEIEDEIDGSSIKEIQKIHKGYKKGESSTNIDQEYKRIILDILLKEVTRDDSDMKKLCIDDYIRHEV